MAGGKTSGKKKSPKVGGGDDRTNLVVKGFFGAVMAIGIAALTGLLLQWRTNQYQQAQKEHLDLLGKKVELQTQLQSMMEEMQRAEQEKASAAKSEGQGPGLMQAQAKMITRLLELVQEVDSLRGDEQREQRLAASRRVEEELLQLEAEISQGDSDSALGKQQAGLIALVRDALKSDREGGSVDEEQWSDEVLRQKHGLVTYATPAYWEDAYDSGRYGESFEWYGAWAEDDVSGKSLSSLVSPLLPKPAKTLVLGCGNSNMSSDIHSDGFGEIVSVDISEKVIQQMVEKYKEVPGLSWHQADASKMSFGTASFDAVIEKGLFDSLYAGTGEKARSVLEEVLRVLKPGGKLISISFADDRIRRLFDAEEGGVKLPVSCSIISSLTYRKAEGEDEASKAIHVYSCERHT